MDTTATVEPTVGTAGETPVSEPSVELVEGQDLLVEDVSIDGMCGVY